MDKDSHLLFEMYGKAQCIGRARSKAEDAEGTNFVTFIKGMPTKDLLELYKEDLHVYHSGNHGDYSHSVADSNLMFMHNELLERGISKDELRALNNEINSKAGDSENAEESTTLLSQLEEKGESFTANETQQMINNIAQKCHTLLTGGGAGEYSGIKLNNKQRQVLEQIGKLVVTI